MMWSVSEQHQAFGHYWTLLSTTDGVTRTRAVFYGDDGEQLAKRWRDPRPHDHDRLLRGVPRRLGSRDRPAPLPPLRRPHRHPRHLPRRPDHQEADVSSCRSCGAPVLWVVTQATGKAMPLDAEPNPDGNVTLTSAPNRTSLAGTPLQVATVHATGQGAMFDSGDRYMPHHATCPHADQWRKPKEKAPR